MALRVIVVGPGRVGAALARQLAQCGVEILGFVGRDPARTAGAIAFAGCGRALEAAAHPTAHAVLFAVGDGDLEVAIGALLAAAPPRRCSLWFHTSGRHDLGVFDAAASVGARRGALHPVAPFADAESGFARMAGQPAVILADPASERLLRAITRRLGMRAIVAGAQRRALYHAGCAMAANGLVALRGLVDAVFAAAGGLERDDAEAIADALMANALANAAERGAAAALSGPVLRGDVATIAAHLGELTGAAPQAVATYRALMSAALELAVARGLPAAAAAALRRELDDPAQEP